MNSLIEFLVIFFLSFLSPKICLRSNLIFRGLIFIRLTSFTLLKGKQIHYRTAKRSSFESFEISQLYLSMQFFSHLSFCFKIES